MIKRLIAMILVIVTLSFKIYATDDEVMLRIGLFFGNTAKSSVNIGCTDGLTIICEGIDDYYINEAKTITISKGEIGFIINDIGEYKSNVIHIKPKNGAYIEIDGEKYRGYVEILRQANSDMTVINIVNIEEYLYSVVGKEMSPSFNIEALKAQAVCARNYALTNLNKYEKYGFNLCSTQSSQVYQGVKSEHEKTILAVNETRGMVAKYDGKLCSLFYFASSGGKTENSENVWVTSLPYLRGVVDTYENPNEATRANWIIQYSALDIKNKLAERGIDIGDILDLKIIKRTENDRVHTLKIIGTNGEKELSKESSRIYLSLYSQNYTINSDTTKLYDINKNRISDNAFVLTSSGKVKIVDRFVLGINGISAPKNENKSGVFTFVGKGWGHGVGMSQWGAKGMADAGFKYDEILKHYFTGVEITDVNS